MDKKYDKELSLIKAKILLKLNRFYSSLIVSIRYKFKKDDNITAYTNGVVITLGCEFWDGLNIKERIFLLLHELNHIVLKHVNRFNTMKYDDKNSRLYNISADFFINNMLMEDNVDDVYEFIEGGCLDSKYLGLSTDQIYQLINKDLGYKDPNNGKGGDGIGQDLKSGGATKEEEAEIDNIIKQAVGSNKNFTSNAQYMEELAIYSDEHVINWKSSLLRYMRNKFKSSKSYRKPNRRTHHNKRLILKVPKVKLKIGDLLVYIDVSGSCEDGDITSMYSELSHIMSEYKPDSIIFRTFNTSIQQSFIVNSKNDLPKNIQISGGTEIQCVINDIDNHEGKVCLAILMSDMYSDEFAKPETVPLLMLVINNPDYKSDVGEVIIYS